jgi:hypothetical protein
MGNLAQNSTFLSPQIPQGSLIFTHNPAKKIHGSVAKINSTKNYKRTSNIPLILSVDGINHNPSATSPGHHLTTLAQTPSVNRTKHK